MKVCAVISALCFISLVSALPLHHGMLFKKVQREKKIIELSCVCLIEILLFS